MHLAPSPVRFTVIVALTAACTLGAAAIDRAHAQMQTKGQQRCITQLNRAGARVVGAQGKATGRCLKNASRALLLPETVQSCLSADSTGRVGKAALKTLTAHAKACAASPSFGSTDATTVNAAAIDENLALTADIFGPDLGASVRLSAFDRIGAACQQRVQRAYEKLLVGRLKTFGKCKKKGLKAATIDSAEALSQCLDATTNVGNAKIAKLAEKLAITVAGRCAGTDPLVVFPGQCASEPGLADCIEASVSCRLCNTLRAMDSLTADCDEFDDGEYNASCGVVVTTTTTSTTLVGPTTTSTTSTTLPGGGGACTNPADASILITIDAQAEITTCGAGCFLDPDKTQCIADCVETATGLSVGCSLCYGQSGACGIDSCLTECAADPTGQPCLDCVALNCTPALEACTGLSATTTTTVSTTVTTTTVSTTTTMPLSGECTNPTDDAVHMSFDLLSEATTCTIPCLGSPTRPQCIADCLVSATGLTGSCALCYGQSAECGILNCAAQCAADPSGQPCLDCIDANCTAAFDVCSGLGTPASCSDGTLNGDESDVDCGGSCPTCPVGDDCNDAADCTSGECVAGVCSAPSTAIAFDACAAGFIDAVADPDAIDLSGGSSGSDDGYVLTIASTVDAFIELTNLPGSTSVLEAALVTVPGDAGSTIAGLATGSVSVGQNGTGGPVTLLPGTYFLYVDSDVAGTSGPYQVCVVAPPTVALDDCTAGSVGNGDGDDVAIAGELGEGGDKGIRFTPPSNTSVIVSLRNLSGTGVMAAGIFDGASLVGGSETGDAAAFTERTAGPALVSGGTAYTVQVDTADADSFGNFDVCVREAGCGDGLVLGGEQCDDANQVGGDGCNASCNLESGHLVVDSCRTDSIPLFPIGDDCDDWALPIHADQDIFVEVTNHLGDTLLARGELRQGGTVLSSTNNVSVAQSGSTAVTTVSDGTTYTVRVCDVTGAGTGSYTVCARPARTLELGSCYSSNVTDGDGNVIDLAGPISGGDEDVIFRPPLSTNVKLTLSHDGGGGLLAAGVYTAQPGSLVSGSAVGASPAPIPVGGSGESGSFAINAAQTYRVYTDIASLGTAGNDYTICIAEVPSDACVNAADELVRETVDIAAAAEAAGLSCLGDGACITSQLESTTGLSPACASCYGGTGSCAAGNCALQCLGDSGSSGCRNCVASNCAQEFEICSGWLYGG